MSDLSNQSSLTRGGYKIPKAGMSHEDLERLRAELVAAPIRAFQNGAGPPITFPIYAETGSDMYVPRAFGLKRFGPVSVDETPTGVETIDVKFEGSLRDAQREAVDAFLQAARDRARCGGLLCMYPGFGKTVCGIYLMHALAVKTMVVVHMDFLLDQWAERIRAYAPTARVGLLKAAKIKVHDVDIVLASLQSLCMKTYDPAVFDGFGLLIIDECHHVGAEVFSRALLKTGFQYVLGLSATPTRKDGLTHVIHYHLGDVLYTGAARSDSSTSVRAYKFRSSDPNYNDVPQIFAYGQTRVNLSRMINNVCAFAPRNELIVRAIATAVEEDDNRRVLVLSDRVNHLHDLFARLNQIPALAARRPGFYIGSLPKAQLRETEANARIILATYAMAAEGFDLDSLDTLVLASPKSDVEQSVGRVQRRPGASSLVIDIVDAFSVFAGQAKKRERFFRARGYLVKVAALPAAAVAAETAVAVAFPAEAEIEAQLSTSATSSHAQ